MSASDSPPRLRMPSHYGLFVLAGVVGFVVLVCALVGLYIWLIWSGVSPFVHWEFGRGPVTVQGAVLRIALGLMLCLLAWRSLRFHQLWEGIEVARGSCPQLEELIANCALRAGVPAPDAIYVTPDTNICAFSSGLVRGSGRHSNFINIGAMLLPVLSYSELEAAILHELAHLVMRRAQWGVNLDNHVHEFVPRLKDMNRQGRKVFFMAVVGASVLLLWYWNAFNLLLAPLRRKEELLADNFAAAWCGKEDYGHKLAAIIVAQQALEHGLGDSINGHFHAALLGMRENVPAEEYPNWFRFVRETFSGKAVLPQLSKVLNYLREGEHLRWLDEHPTLGVRLSRLGQSVPASTEELLTSEDSITTDEVWEREISTAFAARFRPRIYKGKLDAGFAADAGLEGEGTATYPCRFKSCKRHGQTHLVISRAGLRWVYTDGSADDIRWHDLWSVEVLPEGRPSGRNGPWIQWLMAMYWGLPSLAEVEIKWHPTSDGGVPMRRLQIFHLGENMQEVMDIINAVWARRRSVAVAQRTHDLPSLLAKLRTALEAETSPCATPELIERQAGIVETLYRCNFKQMRWREFAALLQIYEALLNRAQADAAWVASVKGRAIVLEQLERRQALRSRIGAMGWLSWPGRLLWIPIWGRALFAVGILLSLTNAAYLGVMWHHHGMSLGALTSAAFASRVFRASFQFGLILLFIPILVLAKGMTVMEDVDITAIRAMNCKP